MFLVPKSAANAIRIRESCSGSLADLAAGGRHPELSRGVFVRIGLLADIHDDTKRLTAALVELARHHADRIVVLGDTPSPGARKSRFDWELGAAVWWPSRLSATDIVPFSTPTRPN